MSQTSIVYPLPIGLAGQLADVSWNDVLTYANTDTVNLGYGLMVMKGTGDQDALEYTGAATGIGVVVLSMSSDNGPFGDLDTLSAQVGLKPHAPLNILRCGRIYVVVEEAVAAYDRAFIRKSTGAGGSLKGSFRKSADSGTADDFTKKIQYLSSAGAGGIALAEVNMLNS